MLRHPIARFVVATATVGALADWILFATLVVTVDRLLGATAFATALVLVARILPGVLFAPLAARRIDRRDLPSSLLTHEGMRIAAVAGLAAGFAARNVVAVVASILVLEFAAAMQAAGRESLISRHVSAVHFTRVNTATVVTSYGLLPAGALLVGIAGPTVGWVLALAGYGVVAAAYLRLRIPADVSARPAAPSSAAPSSAAPSSAAPAGRGAAPSPVSGRPWVRIVVAAALGLLPVVALFTVGPDAAEVWLGDRTATGPLYALVLAGAAGGVVAANTRQVRADLAMGLAAAGLGIALLGAWPVGLLAVGAGAGAAYLELQTRLQYLASDPSEFAAAFAGLKISAGVAAVGAPVVLTSTGLAGVLTMGTAVALAGAAVASPAPSRLARIGVRELLGVLLRLVVRVEVAEVGRRIPGPAVVVSNHPHWLDGAVVVQADRSLRPVARWQRHLGARLGIWAGHCVVTTAGTDRDRRPAFEQAADHLRDGGRIWLAPEGGAHARPVLRRPRSGAVRMAAAAEVPIQPLAIRWADGIAGPRLADWRPWRRPVVRVTWGRPVRPVGDVDADGDRMMRALADAAGLAYEAGHGPAPAAASAAASMAPRPIPVGAGAELQFR